MRKLLAALILCHALPAAAQQPPPRPELRVERIAPGVAVLFGRGGNIGVSYGADGNILIDDQYAPATERVIAAVRTLDPDPIRYVLNTHWHGDHTGGNENLGRTGTVIVAHDNVRIRMTMAQVVRGERVPPSPSGALPVITFSEDLTFHLNGDDIRAIHVDHAHTDGDSLIYWTRANVLHMGDTFFNGLLPFIDLDSGGSIDGAIAAVETALGLANEETRIIPGHGPMARRADLVRYRDMLRSLRDSVARAIRQRRTLEQIKAMRLVDPFGLPDGFIARDSLIETIYLSLTRPPARGHR
ncbi:MAG TPA: MBL fold metallo-hydrolase [Allosphingosinicella sp.]|nr:MBL fold metallo-hydrolase [Allosphingosinicella sp.]